MQAESVLEFENLRAVVARYVRSALGRDAMERIAPGSDRAAIEEALADAAEGITYIQAALQPQAAQRGAAIRIRFGEIADPGTSVARLRIEGAALEATEILEVARMLDLASEARAILTGLVFRFPRLAKHAESIADLRSLANDLRSKILPDGSLADDASVALARMRRDAERQRNQIQASLEKFLRAHHEDGTLQEDFVTIRDDRFVVPVVTGRERRVEGVIHGASGSGHTLFVEPLETIELNNELVRLREEEMREVHRILREFTSRLRVHAAEIAATAAALGKLELIFAKAEFAVDFDCTIPRLSPPDARKVVLRDARHPLLEDLFRKQRKTVVPISLALDESQRTLLISGPNTGGKTVSLKTSGLLALMTHAGLPVPAAEAEFPLFDNILADIGDHQSIQESLSSFSAHIMSMKSMLESATAQSLVLVDELGRATDPEEGGPLGVAILDAFRKRGGFTLASTHLLAMKIYGASTEGVLNASMGFDDQTLQPTYVLKLGAPGKSAGLDIARRIGLDRELIDSARTHMSTTERDIAAFLSELHARLDAAAIERGDLAAREREITLREQSLEVNWERRYAAKILELEKRANELAAQFEQRAEAEIGELSQKARARIGKTKREYREALETSIGEIAPATRLPLEKQAPKLKIEEGARVRLKGIRQPANVRRVLEHGMIEVDAGFMKMQVPETDVEEVLAAPGNGQGAKKPSITFHQGPSFDTPYREINVIGQRAEQAIEQVDKFLDNAALAQVERVRIVHGHGMGILKRAMADLLKSNPHVEKFYSAPPEQGGAGATVVELK